MAENFPFDLVTGDNQQGFEELLKSRKSSVRSIKDGADNTLMHLSIAHEKYNNVKVLLKNVKKT